MLMWRVPADDFAFVQLPGAAGFGSSGDCACEARASSVGQRVVRGVDFPRGKSDL